MADRLKDKVALAWRLGLRYAVHARRPLHHYLPRFTLAEGNVAEFIALVMTSMVPALLLLIEG